MGKYVTLPTTMALDYILKPDEHIICTNASIAVNEEGDFSCWLDNEGYVTIYVEEEDNDI